MNHAMLLSNPSHYLSLKYTYSRFRSQLADSVVLAKEALKVSKVGNLSDVKRHYATLATSLASRFEKFGDLKDFERAVSISETALTVIPAGKAGKACQNAA